MGPTVGILLALAVIGYVGTSGAVADLFYPEPEVPLALDPRVAELVAAHRGLSHPLPCTVTVAQRTSGPWEGPRCYVAKSTKEAQ